MGFDTSLTRREVLGGAAGAGFLLPWAAELSRNLPQVGPGGEEITEADLAAIEKVAGLQFSDEERKAALAEVKSFRKQYEDMRKAGIPYDVPPATTFQTLEPRSKVAKKAELRWERPKIDRPAKDEDLAWLTLAEIAELIRGKKLSSVELTSFCLGRLKRYGPGLQCVVTLLEDQAMRDARKADQEIAAGRYRGPLHGVPCGIKDLFALAGAPTTWGAEPFQDQNLDYDSAVTEMLRKAGAVICAKLTLGGLAMDDKWFGGQTKNPWNPKEGSSGSSAGSASAVAAGLVPFAIGTETLGSIVSPSHRCRVTGLRPTFGRISRHGAMALSWTMDKVGPICRTAQDCAIVLAALSGRDARDPSTSSLPFAYRNPDIRKLKVGVLEGAYPLDDEDDPAAGWTKLLSDIGVQTTSIKMTAPADITLLGLSVEGAAAFDEITRTGAVNAMKYSLWPNIFRQQRYALAVEHMQSLRARRMLMDQFERELGDFDVVLASDRGSHLLLSTNLTGHPQLYVPLGPDAQGRARGVSLIGRLYEEESIAALGWAMQKANGFYRKHPEMGAIG